MNATDLDSPRIFGRVYDNTGSIIKVMCRFARLLASATVRARSAVLGTERCTGTLDVWSIFRLGSRLARPSF